MSHVLESRFTGKCIALVPLIAVGVVTVVGVVTEVDAVTAGGVATALCGESSWSVDGRVYWTLVASCAHVCVCVCECV